MRLATISGRGFTLRCGITAASVVSLHTFQKGPLTVALCGQSCSVPTTSFSSLRASTLGVEVVETFVVDLPIIRPHLLSVATMQAQTLMIVKIVCSDGITGFGEGTTIGGLSYGAESPEGMKLAIDQYIAPILKSANPARVPETMIAIRKAIKGNNFAKCAVETALLDAWGKRIGLPMSELVGGRLRDRLAGSVDACKR